ncbi:MAG: hypothetical protein U9R43_10645, partial [Thermodesulfobacteriota bacterium]|nr:hypothetical protein [Thermodesulfobacteriota bacterium]
MSSAKSRLAGAGFEPRRFAAGFRLRLNLPTWFESCPKIKKKLAFNCQILYHSILVRLLNTLLFLKSDVKSRFAGAGFEPRRF